MFGCSNEIHTPVVSILFTRCIYWAYCCTWTDILLYIYYTRMQDIPYRIRVSDVEKEAVLERSTVSDTYGFHLLGGSPTFVVTIVEGLSLDFF